MDLMRSGGSSWAREGARATRLREGMIDVYERLSASNPNMCPPYLEVTRILSSLVERLGECSQRSPIKPWLAVLRYESQGLLDLLSAAVAMQAWTFFPSLMLLQRGAGLLSQWEEVVAARETRKLSFASTFLRGVTGWVEPHLYLWMARLKAALLSKFSLYFHATLARQTSSSEMARLCSKLAIDQPSRLLLFQRR